MNWVQLVVLLLISPGVPCGCSSLGAQKKKKILIPSGLKQPLYGFTRLSGGESRLLAGATSALHVTSSEV